MENENNNKSNEPKVSVSEVLNMLSKLLSPQDVIFAKITAQFVSALTQIRSAGEYSIEEFAELLKTTPDIVNEWETGHHNFNFKEVADICYILNIDIDIDIKPKESVDD